MDRGRDDARPWPRPGDVAPGQLGPISGRRRRARPRTTLSMSRAGMRSVMQKMVRMPASDRLQDGVGGAGRRDEDAGSCWRRSRATASATVSKTGTRLVERRAGRPCRASCRPRSPCRRRGICAAWNSPSRPVMPWTTRRRVAIDEDAHRRGAAPRAAATAFWAASSRLAPSRSAAASAGSRRPRRRWCRRSGRPSAPRGAAGARASIRPARDLVAAGDAAEDVDQDGAHARVGQDQAHRRGHLVGPGAAADVEEVGRLAAVPA